MTRFGFGDLHLFGGDLFQQFYVHCFLHWHFYRVVHCGSCVSCCSLPYRMNIFRLCPVDGVYTANGIWTIFILISLEAITSQGQLCDIEYGTRVLMPSKPAQKHTHWLISRFRMLASIPIKMIRFRFFFRVFLMVFCIVPILAGILVFFFINLIHFHHSLLGIFINWIMFGGITWETMACNTVLFSINQQNDGHGSMNVIKITFSISSEGRWSKNAGHLKPEWNRRIIKLPRTRHINKMIINSKNTNRTHDI